MIINGINSKDISFVVQGAIDKIITPKCLKSIRKNFPECTIILSTWKNSITKELDYDELVINDDPGAVICDYHSIPNNINRQILSSYAGLEKVKTKYAAKVRSDLIFDSPKFLNFFDSFPAYNKEYKHVKSRMIILSLYTRLFYINYNKYNLIPATFHFSDWFYFGFTEDVKRYFSAELIEDLASFSNYYLTNKEFHNKLPYPHLMLKITPEQYLGYKFFFPNADYDIQSIGNIKFQDYIKYLVNNFIVLDYAYSGIYSDKWMDRSQNEWIMHPFEVGSLVFFSDFLKYYKNNCDPNYIIPDNIDRINENRKLLVLRNVMWKDKIRNYRHMVWEKIKHKLRFVKKVMRTILPAYRVADATRDILLNLKNEENDRFNYLVYRANCLEEQNKKQSQQIKSLKKQIRAVTNTENDEDK